MQGLIDRAQTNCAGKLEKYIRTVIERENRANYVNPLLPSTCKPQVVERMDDTAHQLDPNGEERQSGDLAPFDISYEWHLRANWI